MNPSIFPDQIRCMIREETETNSSDTDIVDKAYNPIDEYLRIVNEIENKTIDSLKFWENNEKRFPGLSRSVRSKIKSSIIYI